MPLIRFCETKVGLLPHAAAATTTTNNSTTNSTTNNKQQTTTNNNNNDNDNDNDNNDNDNDNNNKQLDEKKGHKKQLWTNMILLTRVRNPVSRVFLIRRSWVNWFCHCATVAPWTCCPLPTGAGVFASGWWNHTRAMGVGEILQLRVEDRKLKGRREKH